MRRGSRRRKKASSSPNLEAPIKRLRPKPAIFSIATPNSDQHTKTLTFHHLNISRRSRISPTVPASPTAAAANPCRLGRFIHQQVVLPPPGLRALGRLGGGCGRGGGGQPAQRARRQREEAEGDEDGPVAHTPDARGGEEGAGAEAEVQSLQESGGQNDIRCSGRQAGSVGIGVRVGQGVWSAGCDGGESF